MKKLNDRFAKLKDYLKSNDKAGKEKPDKAELEQAARNGGYLRLSAKDYLSEHPSWVIRKATVRGLSVHEKLPTMTVQAQNLSSKPSLHPEPMEIRAAPDERAVKEFQAKLGQALKDKMGEALNDKLGDDDTENLIKDLFK